mmetsp:Transcript_35007/g.66878  ORF Transcript_35007/g.66878 Transcript_35007/m.66878 type:complete len:120 (-) Transcript_35007:322-681(-)|eukprot:CAMPEP_0114232410 /NCGR_PEP_ID=MMETSP0058-20121206/4589_1 /TAXON_ID=36894 /ORGANISM="Pyramimonas parkeae, CCMP726" /LENGTH=119 /DNA_ID=CAMNT_0001343877 /DNA_START=269 /DNA_END=628 /DNA_ORIENTATION=+
MEEEQQETKPKGPNLAAHKISVIGSLMPQDHETQAIEVCAMAIEAHKNTKDMATYCKKEYDKRFPPSGKATEGVFHVIVGKNFGASLSHETRAYVHLKIDLLHFIIFKSKDSPFDVEDS